MAPKKQWQRTLTFGGRLPWAVGLTLALTLVLSLLTAFGDRHAGPVSAFLALRPAGVWHGQVWRLLTWVFVEPSPLSLIFGCLSLYWFGGPLAGAWGPRRFLSVIGGVTLAAGVGTCLIALADPDVSGAFYLGGWAMTTALLVAWGLSFPNQVVRIYFLIPIRGYWLAWLTVAVTAVYAIYTGWASSLPVLIAQWSILAWLFRKPLFSRIGHLSRQSKVRKSVDERLRELNRPNERGNVVDLRPGGRADPDDRKPN